jgi:hypothetical protein
MVLAMEIVEASAKVRAGPPDDDDTEDAALHVWAGELPITRDLGAPVPSPGLRPGIELALSIAGPARQTKFFEDDNSWPRRSMRGRSAGAAGGSGTRR